MRKLFIYLMVFAFIPGAVYSQSSKLEKINLTGEHSINLNLGFLNPSSSVTVDPQTVSTHLNFQGSLSYNYWFTNELAVEGNAGVIDAHVHTSTNPNGSAKQETASVIPYFMGVKYSPEVLAIAKNIRPYGTVLLGGVTGFGTEISASLNSAGTSTYSETSVALKTGVGADALLSSLVKIGLFADYLVMSDFNRPVGDRNNFSGFNLSFNVGFTF